MRINIHTSHPSAFISSTFLDLKNERDAVASILQDSKLNINALDIKPASNNSSKKEILTGIKESDFIILIIGNRYGTMDPKITNNRILSITKWEYEKAVKNYGKHILVYFKNTAPDDKMFYDDESSNDYNEKQELLTNFKTELSKNHSPKYFSTADELAEEVKKSIIPIYRAGVKELISKNKLLSKEIYALRLQNERLMKPTEEVIDKISLRGIQDLIGNDK